MTLAVNPTPATGLAVPQPSNDDITRKLQELGLIQKSTSDINRIKVDGLTFTVGDEMYVSNPKTKAPAFRARLMGAPIEYQARWLDSSLANAIGRAQDADTFCKSYFEEANQARNFSESGAPCRTCQVSPFCKKEALPAQAEGQRCSWRADIQLQVLDNTGAISDPTVWTLTLPTTGVIEFKGTNRDPEKGHVSEYNFMQKLARFGMDCNPDNPNRGLMEAVTGMSVGAVIVDVRAVQTQSQDGSRRYNVIVFDPVDIIKLDETPALGDGADDNGDNLPF